MKRETIAILDFGSQYTQLIARRIRSQHVYCQILPPNISMDDLQELSPKGIILSGGPSSVYAENAPKMDENLLELDIPILGICYGMQLIGLHFHGQVESATRKEYGETNVEFQCDSPLFGGLPQNQIVWMSHGDSISQLPPDFEAKASSGNCPYVAFQHKHRPLFGIQFHPEVTHTEYGMDMLNNFVFGICQCQGNWTPQAYIDSMVQTLQNQIGSQKVICGLSGGVDSTVAATLIQRAIGDNLICIFVNNGLLRKNEAEEVLHQFRDNLHFNLVYVDASQRFLDELNGISDPEQKRKIIGRIFIEIFEEEANKLGSVQFLAQGTLYPDVIESVAFVGPSQTIKSHHNVGGLPEKMNMKLVEPLRELFKDEVRAIGTELGIPEQFIGRHPFPGPGLAIRVPGTITPEKLAILQEADHIFINILRKHDLYDQIWQAFAVLLPVKTVGVMGDERTYEYVCALRAVTSHDGMTAHWAKIPYHVLAEASSRIINEVRGINRVVYDISSKPPGTIEWE